MNKLSIKNLPESDRPYEKFEKLGVSFLSDAELLALVIKSGSRGLNCVDIARHILSTHDNGLSGFKYLKEVSVDELKQIPGIGKVKAIQLKGIMELADRINTEFNRYKKSKIVSPQDVYNLLGPDMKNKKVEEVKVIILDNKMYVKSIVTISVGATNKSSVSMKEFLSEPIKQLASSIIVVHNHPSGDTTPSRQDIILTRKLVDYARVFEINLADHVIIGENNYTSIKETNSDIFLGGRLI